MTVSKPADHAPRKSSHEDFHRQNETVQRDWYVVDAEGKTLGRLAAALAYRLRGKHNPFSPRTSIPATTSS